MSELKLQQSRLDGRYDILECLGRGSYAEIYVANDNAAPEGAARTIVIKALNLYLQDAPDAELERTLVTNFQNEAVALDRVRHPNVINRLGHGTAIDLAGTTFHYIVLEYLPGGDLFALTKTRPLSLKRALFYLEQVCSGLAHAHKCGVIHRDIKPQNLLLTADQEVVKIADFGVARLDNTDGAITRVGTNIYSAPEHNPLMQTGQLDTTGLRLQHVHLTPAADIYSLAKTTYTLLAGESPRRFAQHAISELPSHISEEFWSRPVLRVLEKATQNRPEARYQTVEEFWDDIADASLPPTRPLQMVTPELQQMRRKPSADLSVEPEEEFTEAAPPRPHFDVPRPVLTELDSQRRPRIVVPISVGMETRRQRELQTRQDARVEPERRFETIGPPVTASVFPASRKRRALVALGLILAFSGMLLATHKYVTTHWNPLTTIQNVEPIGRQGVTTTDVNLRPIASSANNAPIGLAESGSKVKILNADPNWYEVQVLEHARPKTDPYSSDRGWIRKIYVKFD
ncbi:MAG TPA: serine/threonine-protein kinase [Pyrinomonadaceae bacterium]|jgi:serine/threonine protein kinase|nr:serine/threonine-protein kinase [Pyrinomonadaceae bacterium]